jgi:calcium-dependent protein kinase
MSSRSSEKQKPEKKKRSIRKSLKVSLNELKSLAKTRWTSRLIRANNSRIGYAYSLAKEPIARGAAGMVFIGTEKVSGEERAVKKCFKAVSSQEDLVREAATIRELDHPNIIKLYETFEDKNCIYFVMELCTGGCLGERISEAVLTQKEAATIMQQILRALSHMHQMYLCHRDLKPENCLLVERGPLEKAVLKLIDLGSAAHVQPGAFLNTVIGTPCYMAPEVIDGHYDISCDMWSCV